tara:strand:+ start:1378 stop:1578 length:201 start_codon:yes stop_codon:yes gene_type:complete
MSKKKVSFEDALDNDDFGLIIDKDGNLKGLFVPDNADDELDFVPDTIVQILEKVYGINMGDEVTMH